LPPWIGLAELQPPVAVAVGPDGSRQRRRGVRGRRLILPREHLMTADEHIVTTPARTWLDCADRVPVEHHVAMGDAILHRNLATPADLDSIVRWGRGRRGIRTARRSLPMLDGRAESPGESLTRYHLMEGGVVRPTCNYNVVVDGEWLARVDLAWPRQRVAVEYDGIVHLSEAARRNDAARRNLLQDAGWIVIVFTAADLKHPWHMAALVRSALSR
jgi:hypothetical protein